MMEKLKAQFIKGCKSNPEFIEGYIEMNKKFIMVLNIDRVLNVEELAEISHLNEE